MSRHQTPGFTRRPRIADQLTPDLDACVRSAGRAERAADATEALEWMSAVPMLARGRHLATLKALAQLGDDLPPWVSARWLVYQTTRCDDQGSRTGDLFRRAVKYATETVHSDLLTDCYEAAGDPIAVLARVAGQSWFFHQAFPYEFGGLEAYLEEFIDSTRFPHVDLARRWARTPLGGYRVGDSLPGSRLRVHDPVTDAAFEVIDIGARSAAATGGWVVGRVVPTGLGDLTMFDNTPLPVSERVAVEVTAQAGEGAWAPITAALKEGRLQPAAFLREDYELLTDIQELDLLAYGTRPADLDRVMRQLRSGRDEVGRAAFRVLRDAVEGRVPERDAAFVAAAALNPHAHAEAVAQLCRPRAQVEWQRWAGMVPSPARQRLTALAAASGAGSS